MNGLYTRSVSRLQALPLVVAGAGVCLGILFARGEWVYALAMVAFVVVLMWPVEATLGTYAFLLPFDSISRLGTSPDGRTLTWYVGAVTTVVLLGMGLLHDKLIRPPRAAWYWLGFLAWGALSVFWALDENVVFAQLPTVFGLLALYFAAVCFDISKQQLSRIISFAIAGGFAASVFSIRNFLTGISTIEARSSLIAGAQQADPNVYAASLVIPLALAIAAVLAAKNLLEKTLLLAACFTITLAILLTMSRGAILALACMAGVYVYRFRLNRWILLVLSLLPLALFALPALFFSRFQNALASGGAGRLDIWKAGLSALTHFGLQGAGLANFQIAYQQFAGFAPIFRGYDRPAHNIYLQVSVELGILGITFLLMAVFWHLRGLWALGASLKSAGPRATLIACEAMSLGILVSAFFVGFLWQKSFWMVWILCALAVQTTSTKTFARAPEY